MSLAGKLLYTELIYSVKFTMFNDSNTFCLPLIMFNLERGYFFSEQNLLHGLIHRDDVSFRSFDTLKVLMSSTCWSVLWPYWPLNFLVAQGFVTISTNHILYFSLCCFLFFVRFVFILRKFRPKYQDISNTPLLI